MSKAKDNDRWRRPEKELPDGEARVEAWVLQPLASGPVHRDDAIYSSHGEIWLAGYYNRERVTCLAWRPLRPVTRPAWVKNRKGE